MTTKSWNIHTVILIAQDLLSRAFSSISVLTKKALDNFWCDISILKKKTEHDSYSLGTKLFWKNAGKNIENTNKTMMFISLSCYNYLADPLKKPRKEIFIHLVFRFYELLLNDGVELLSHSDTKSQILFRNSNPKKTSNFEKKNLLKTSKFVFLEIWIYKQFLLFCITVFHLLPP